MTSEDISSDFPFKSNYIDVLGSKIHYVDEGKGDPVLFLHGNPTSSYLWRNIIPYLAPRARCIAPDLIGMGRSDKPDISYRFAEHVEYIEGFIEKMGLRNITLVIHDWGSALGFHYAMRHEDNIKGIAFMEAILKPLKWSEFSKEFRIGFKLFRTPLIGWFMICVLNVFIEKILPKATVRGLTKDEMDHYREPFKNINDRKPVLMWPNEIPVEGMPADVAEIVQSYFQKLQVSDIPKLLFYGDPGGLIKKPMAEWCRENLTYMKVIDIGSGLHYLQEDNPHLIGSELAEWYKRL